MGNIFEKREGRENLEQLKTKVVLDFMRHGKKEKAEEGQSDNDVRLTAEGRKMSRDKGFYLDPQVEVSSAVASPKKRAQETAYHTMLPEVDVDATLEEINRMIDDALSLNQKKLRIDKRLDFNMEGPEGKEMLEAFKKGEYLQYLVNQSDQRAVELGDEQSSTYSRYAGNIAENIARYSQIGNNFNSIISKDSVKGYESKGLAEKYQKFGNQLNKYLATHQGVVEGFMAKVLEKTEGKEKRDEFIKSLGGGFNETEGIHVEILNAGKDQEIVISFKVNNEENKVTIKADLLNEIIKERNDLDKAIKDKLVE